jgi:2-polyprenyl-6-methoxyphenol hydroxylase-like FAD-dependent oxidoreductase
MINKKVLIVGAGITGSTLAALLEQHGIAPTVIDSARKSDPNGYGITIMPRGLQVLETLGIRPEMEKAGNILKGCKLYDESEHELNSFPLSTADIESITLSRGSLLDILRNRLKQTRILWETSIKKLSQSKNGVLVTLTNGHTSTYDLVVGADGVNSVVRSKIFPGTKPEKVGAGIWMASLPEGCKITDHKFGHLVFGDYRFMALFPYKQTAAVAFTMPLDTEVDPQTVDYKQVFAGMSHMSDKILQSIDDSQLYRGHLRQLKLNDWYNRRVVLAGDAAHAMLPATGMGASNGIQDTAVLAHLIGEMPLELFDELPARYQKLQKPLIDAKQREAFIMGHVMLMHKYQAAVRNKVFTLIPHSLLGMAAVRH